MLRELLFQVCHGFPQQVTVAGGVYAGVVSRGFDPQQRAETTEGSEQWFETSICFPAVFEDLRA